MSSRTLLFASLAFASLSLFGCDPGMPGVAGQADLGPGLDAAQFQNLEMRAIPAEGVFNPLSPIFPTAVSDNLFQDGEGESAVWTGDIESQERGVILLQRGEPLSGVTFPYAYTLGGDGIGYTEEGKWRLFFWLSNNPDSHLDKAPSSGDPYGFVDYDALDCGMSGFCGVKEGVNIAINQTAP